MSEIPVHAITIAVPDNIPDNLYLNYNSVNGYFDITGQVPYEPKYNIKGASVTYSFKDDSSDLRITDTYTYYVYDPYYANYIFPGDYVYFRTHKYTAFDPLEWISSNTGGAWSGGAPPYHYDSFTTRYLDNKVYAGSGMLDGIPHDFYQWYFTWYTYLSYGYSGSFDIVQVLTGDQLKDLATDGRIDFMLSADEGGPGV